MKCVMRGIFKIIVFIMYGVISFHRILSLNHQRISVFGLIVMNFSCFDIVRARGQIWVLKTIRNHFCCILLVA
jgi:hypothetical protein